MNERQTAMMKAEVALAENAYFNAKENFDTPENRRLFQAGFERGYQVEQIKVEWLRNHRSLDAEDD